MAESVTESPPGASALAPGEAACRRCRYADTTHCSLSPQITHHSITAYLPRVSVTAYRITFTACHCAFHLSLPNCLSTATLPAMEVRSLNNRNCNCNCNVTAFIMVARSLIQSRRIKTIMRTLCEHQ